MILWETTLRQWSPELYYIHLRNWKDLCSKFGFNYFSSLLQIEKLRNEGSITCCDCGNEYNDEKEFKLHYQSHTHPYCCSVCKQFFRTSSGFGNVFLMFFLMKYHLLKLLKLKPLKFSYKTKRVIKFESETTIFVEDSSSYFL